MIAASVQKPFRRADPNNKRCKNRGRLRQRVVEWSSLRAVAQHGPTDAFKHADQKRNLFPLNRGDHTRQAPGKPKRELNAGHVTTIFNSRFSKLTRRR